VSAPIALIVGITGQDGAYLARLLLRKGYRVHGTSRNAGMAELNGLIALRICDDISLHTMVPRDPQSVWSTLERIRPQEVYNVAGPSSVALSFREPAESFASITLGTLNVLESLRRFKGPARFYNSGSSECFGDTDTEGANEGTLFQPKSPYGHAKAAGISLTRHYRETYGLFACSGLLFNHESPLRGREFVTRKIARAAARIGAGGRERLSIGDLSIHRDWGWAPDYVEAMWKMLQCDEPRDYVVASGVAHSLQQFVAAAFAEAGLDWREHVDHDPSLLRPADISYSLGDSTKARRTLQWHPTIGFEEVIARMVRAEQQACKEPVR